MDAYYKYEIKINESLCTGCMACVLACSYYHTQSFFFSASAIKIDRDNKEGTIKAYIDEKCNMCEDFEMPSCIQFCAPKAITIIRARASVL